MQPATPKTPAEISPPSWEKHYTVYELAGMWNFGATTLRKWFEGEPGVLRAGNSRIRRDRKNPYVSLRIPESVAWRVYRRHLEKV
jgi:hypothetical protein